MGRAVGVVSCGPASLSRRGLPGLAPRWAQKRHRDAPGEHLTPADARLWPSLGTSRYSRHCSCTKPQLLLLLRAQQHPPRSVTLRRGLGEAAPWPRHRHRAVGAAAELQAWGLPRWVLPRCRNELCSAVPAWTHFKGAWLDPCRGCSDEPARTELARVQPGSRS